MISNTIIPELATYLVIVLKGNFDFDNYVTVSRTNNVFSEIYDCICTGLQRYGYVTKMNIWIYIGVYMYGLFCYLPTLLFSAWSMHYYSLHHSLLILLIHIKLKMHLNARAETNFEQVDKNTLNLKILESMENLTGHTGRRFFYDIHFLWKL